jgi:hypothetical protein
VGPRFDKEPVLLTAVGNAVAQMANPDEATGEIVSRATLSADQMELDLKGKQMVIEQAGKLLIEDYAVRGPADARPSETGPFGNLVGGEPSQTFMQWSGSMLYNFRHNTASFQQDVSLRHLTGARMKLVGQPSLEQISPEAEPRRKGRDAQLTAEVLLVQFLREANAARRDQAGFGSMSGLDLDKFMADGGVFFRDSGVSVMGDRVTYDREHTLLTIFGGQEHPARVYDERGDGFRSMSSPVIYWNRASDRFEAADTTIIGQ